MRDQPAPGDHISSPLADQDFRLVSHLTGQGYQAGPGQVRVFVVQLAGNIENRLSWATGKV